jgi:hypothetical protein
MQWINETDENDRNLAHHCLVLEAHEPLAPAFVAYWKRILSDGRSKAAAWGWRSLSIEILEQQSEADDPGHMRTGFRDAQRKACDGAGDYFLRSHAFACLQGRDEDNKAFSRKQSRWYLEQYAALKNAADSGEVEQLFREINNIRPLFIDAATGWGWFDLQVGQDSFGRLPAEDEALLAGTERKPADRLLDLIGGRDMMTIMQELNAALVAYTPGTSGPFAAKSPKALSRASERCSTTFNVRSFLMTARPSSMIRSTRRRPGWCSKWRRLPARLRVLPSSSSSGTTARGAAHTR